MKNIKFKKNRNVKNTYKTKNENIILENKKIIILTVISIIFLLTLVIVSTYSVLVTRKESNTKDLYKTGNVSVEFTEDTTSNISLSGSTALPTSDDIGSKLAPYTFTVTGTDENSYNSQYTIRIIPQADSVISTDNIKVKVNDNEPALLSSFTNYIVDTGTIAVNESKKFEIRMWIDINSTVDIEGQSFNAKISVSGQAAKS